MAHMPLPPLTFFLPLLLPYSFHPSLNTMTSPTEFVTIPPSTNLYHYTPTRGICYLFVILFCITTAAHVFFAARHRLWWIFPSIVLAGAGEIVGWIARTASSYDPTIRNDYIIQSTCLVLAPTPLLASIFVIFGRLTQCIGSSYGRLTPRLYSRIFLTCDIIALLIQGSGGGIAASANNTSSQKLGSNIMLVGIIFQTVAMVVFIFLAAEFFWRYFQRVQKGRRSARAPRADPDPSPVLSPSRVRGGPRAGPPSPTPSPIRPTPAPTSLVR